MMGHGEEMGIRNRDTTKIMPSGSAHADPLRTLGGLVQRGRSDGPNIHRHPGRAYTKGIMRWVLGLLVGVLVLGIGVLFLPPVADHFGYARPVPDGLPTHFPYYGWELQSTTSGCLQPLQGGHCRARPRRCLTEAFLRRHHYWPLTELTTVPTLLGAAHPVYIIRAPVSLPLYGLFLVHDCACYMPYHRQA